MSQGAVSYDLRRAGVLGMLPRARRRTLAHGRWGRAGRLLPVVVVGALVLVACTPGGSEPTASRTPVVEETTPVPTPTATPTPAPEAMAPPERPAEMERTDEVGAAAAAEYFMQLFAYTMQTGDLSEWDRIGAADCGFCDESRERVRRVYDAGGRIVGGTLTLGEPEHLGYDDVIGVHAAGLPYSFSEGEELDASGGSVAKMVSEEGYAVVDVIFSAGGWTLLGASLGGREA